MLTLHFSRDLSELLEMEFLNPAFRHRTRCVRGKLPGAYRGVGTFQWTSAVQAMSVLLLRTSAVGAPEDDEAQVTLCGYRGSLAASLDYALSKQPVWLLDLFGVDGGERCFARRVFSRSNPERKRPGPVVVAVNTRVLRPQLIKVISNETCIDSRETILTMAHAIECSYGAVHQIAA